jgi:hypothetical protein
MIEFRPRRWPWALACVAILAAASGAHAGSPTPSLDALNAAVRPALAAPAAPSQMSVRPAERTFQRVTMLKTAIDRRLTSDGLTGSLGLLCGRQPNRDISGGAGAFDKDAEGKFMGAQLSRAF